MRKYEDRQQSRARRFSPFSLTGASEIGHRSPYFHDDVAGLRHFVDLNLDTLKREILGYLDEASFAVFRSSPGSLEGAPTVVLWDTEHYPDYQMFLDVARKTGIKLILFGSREFEAGDLDELTEQLETSELPRDEQREYRSRLRDLRSYIGVTCSIELAFDYNQRLYVYELQPDWFESFLELDEEIVTRLADDDIDEDDEPLGGYFSKN